MAIAPEGSETFGKPFGRVGATTPKSAENPYVSWTYKLRPRGRVGC